MLKKLLENKKLVITVSAIVLVIIVLAVLLVKCGSDEPKDNGSNKDGDPKQEEVYDGDGLEIIEDDGKSENRTDTSEYWEGTPKSDDADKKSDDKTTDKQTDTNKTESDKTTEGSTENSESEDGVSNSDTPDDEDMSWGTIY